MCCPEYVCMGTTLFIIMVRNRINSLEIRSPSIPQGQGILFLASAMDLALPASLSCSVSLLTMATLISARELLEPNIHPRPFLSPNLNTDMHPDQRIYYIQFATSTSAHCVGHAIIVCICSNTSKKHGKTHLKINAPFSFLLSLGYSFLLDGRK